MAQDRETVARSTTFAAHSGGFGGDAATYRTREMLLASLTPLTRRAGSLSIALLISATAARA
jgi:hypothetical protein